MAKTVPASGKRLFPRPFAVFTLVIVIHTGSGGGGGVVHGFRSLNHHAVNIGQHASLDVFAGDLVGARDGRAAASDPARFEPTGVVPDAVGVVALGQTTDLPNGLGDAVVGKARGGKDNPLNGVIPPVHLAGRPVDLPKSTRVEQMVLLKLSLIPRQIQRMVLHSPRGGRRDCLGSRSTIPVLLLLLLMCMMTMAMMMIGLVLCQPVADRACFLLSRQTGIQRLGSIPIESIGGGSFDGSRTASGRCCGGRRRRRSCREERKRLSRVGDQPQVKEKPNRFTVHNASLVQFQHMDGKGTGCWIVKGTNLCQQHEHQYLSFTLGAGHCC